VILGTSFGVPRSSRGRASPRCSRRTVPSIEKVRSSFLGYRGWRCPAVRVARGSLAVTNLKWPAIPRDNDALLVQAGLGGDHPWALPT